MTIENELRLNSRFYHDNNDNDNKNLLHFNEYSIYCYPNVSTSLKIKYPQIKLDF